MNSENSERQSAADLTPRIATIIALLTVLLAYPAFRMIVAYWDLFPTDGRPESWWVLWSIILIGHWFCAAVVFSAIASERAGAESIGLNLRAFIRGRFILIAIILAAFAIAYFAPTYLYGEAPPERMTSHPLGPTTAAQRVFWVLIAITAGFVEEVVYRGYAITRLRRFVGLPVALIIAIAAFALMHGPSAFEAQFLAIYIIAGALFSFAFVAMKSKRLEVLIFIHAFLDLMIIAAP